MRTQAVQGFTNQANDLNKRWDKMLDEQGFLGNIADGFKNNFGVDGARFWADSNLGSNTVGKSVGDVLSARDDFSSLKNFQGGQEDFMKAFNDKREALTSKIQSAGEHMKQFKDSQDAWVDGLADVGSVAVASLAVGLAPSKRRRFPGGRHRGQRGDQGRSESRRRLEWGRDYSVTDFGKDALSGGFNGLGAGVGSMARKQATEYMMERGAMNWPRTA